MSGESLLARLTFSLPGAALEIRDCGDTILTGLEERLVLGAGERKIVGEHWVGIRGKKTEAEVIGKETAGEEKSCDCHAAVNGRDRL